jgi:hypothetical protein
MLRPKGNKFVRDNGYYYVRHKSGKAFIAYFGGVYWQLIGTSDMYTELNFAAMCSVIKPVPSPDEVGILGGGIIGHA